MPSALDLSTCPCGGPGAYAACCEPLHDRVRDAATAEELMRSRYAAYAVGRVDHLFRTWHPRTRPADVDVDPGTRWTGLHVLASEAGGVGDDTGWVTFRAAWATTAGNGPDTGVLAERSRFERRAGRWTYVAAERGDDLDSG